MAATERRALIVTDRFLDLLEVLSSAGLVHRVGTVVADQETPAARARVLNADPGASDYGLLVRVIPSAGGGSTVDVTDRGARLLGHVTVDAMPPVSAVTSADVLAVDGDPGYVEGDLGKNLTQTEDGRLRVLTGALVSDTPEQYLGGDVRSLSVTTEGRLRVSTYPANTEMDMAPDFSSCVPDMQNRMWDIPSTPWPI
jgi:hypothetical protein